NTAGRGEDGEFWVVQHVKVSFKKLHSEHGVEFVRENRAAAVRIEAEDATLRRVRGDTNVHRIFRDEDAAVRRDANDGRMLDVRRAGDQVEAPIGRRIRKSTR